MLAGEREWHRAASQCERVERLGRRRERDGLIHGHVIIENS